VAYFLGTQCSICACGCRICWLCDLDLWPFSSDQVLGTWYFVGATYKNIATAEWSWPASYSTLASYHRCCQHNRRRMLATGCDGRTPLTTVDNICSVTAVALCWQQLWSDAQSNGFVYIFNIYFVYIFNCIHYRCFFLLGLSTMYWGIKIIVNISTYF